MIRDDDEYWDVCKGCGAVEHKLRGVCQVCGLCCCGAYGHEVVRHARVCTFPTPGLDDYELVCDCEEWS